MKLILMRHAKSSWDSTSLDDHDRPLNQRGKESATLLGKWLKSNSLLPDQALVSSAARTQETYARLELELPLRPDIKRSLYLATSDQLLDSIYTATGSTLLVLAHNPGIAELALRLARIMGDHPQHTRFGDFPTGATFVIDYPAETWADIDLTNGTIEHFIIPREL